MKSHLILLGAPGSGKGTQSGKFVSEQSYKHLSTGDLLRSEISRSTALGIEVKKVMDAGQLVSDDLVIRLLKANVKVNVSSYIFDGYPRNIHQAKTLDQHVLQGAKSLAVYFDIDTDKLVFRLTNRRTCNSCGAIYNLQFKLPLMQGICDNCGGSDLVQRPDDKEEVILHRLKIFQDKVTPVLEYYNDLNRLLKVNADLPVDEIYKEISSNL